MDNTSLSTDDELREDLLARLRLSCLRGRLIVAEIEAVGLDLRRGDITPAAAVATLIAAGLLEFVDVPKALRI